MRLSFASTTLAVALLAASLTGCASIYDLDRAQRPEQPIPSALRSQMAKSGMSEAAPILVRIFKQESELELWKVDNTGRYALLKTYPICRWSGKLGPKKVEGDRQTPEGFYRIGPSQMNPDSSYYLSFNLGFPNKLDAALGYTGSALMIHGACSSMGCYAITDEAAAELYTVARETFRGGQTAFQVQAYPFRMTPANLALHRTDPNMPYWRALKDGNDLFEVTRQEPVVGYCGRHYTFAPPGTTPPMDPLAACPAVPGDASVAAKQAQDTSDEAAFAAAYPTVPAFAYLDGGMHPSFRSILQRSGPERLAKLTSEKAPISRPEAALADPYVPEKLPGPKTAAN